MGEKKKKNQRRNQPLLLLGRSCWSNSNRSGDDGGGRLPLLRTQTTQPPNNINIRSSVAAKEEAEAAVVHRCPSRKATSSSSSRSALIIKSVRTVMMIGSICVLIGLSLASAAGEINVKIERHFPCSPSSGWIILLHMYYFINIRISLYFRKFREIYNNNELYKIYSESIFPNFLLILEGIFDFMTEFSHYIRRTIENIVKHKDNKIV
jgi:hypothetical protein